MTPEQMPPGAWINLGAIVTLTITTAAAIFRLGHVVARVEALEEWRKTVRADMHEISECLGHVGEELKRLSTLIEERTERRFGDRT